MRPTSQNFFQTSDGARIYFEESGSGRPILLVPGFLGTTRFFCRNTGPLSQGHRVVVMDPRGQGFSSKTPGGNTVLRNARDIAELVEYLNLNDFLLLGWSLASSVALVYATDLDKGRLSGLILVDGSLFPLSGEAWNKHRARDYDVQNWMDTYLPLWQNPREFYDRFVDRISNGAMSPEDRTWVLAECQKTMPWTALELHYDFCHTDSFSRLPRLRVPVAFFGGNSPSYGLEMLDAYAAQVTVPATVCPFHESGHLMFYDEPDHFNRLVMQFSASLPPRREQLPPSGSEAGGPASSQSEHSE